jgi:cytochrome P450
MTVIFFFLGIGSRFALMEAKILIFNLLSKFRIEVCEKTPMKIEYECIVAPIQKNPLYVELIRRS